MNTIQAQNYLNDWMSNEDFSKDSSLLKTQPDSLTPILKEDNSLCMSEELRNRIKEISRIISNDFISDRNIEGVIYTFYSKKNTVIELLYVGIAKAEGKTTGKISSLWKIEGARWSDIPRSNGHIDLLSQGLFYKNKRYSNWAVKLFSPSLKLNDTIYVHFEILKKGVSEHRIIPTLGATPILAEEQLRIWVIVEANKGDSLLNRQGI